MKFSHLTGLRQSDVVNVPLADIDDEGLHVLTGKTGVPLPIPWSDELRA